MSDSIQAIYAEIDIILDLCEERGIRDGNELPNPHEIELFIRAGGKLEHFHKAIDLAARLASPSKGSPWGYACTILRRDIAGHIGSTSTYTRLE